jgi:hypothetical protein
MYVELRSELFIYYKIFPTSGYLKYQISNIMKQDYLLQSV